MKINMAMALKASLLIGALLTTGISAFAVPINGILGFGGEKLFSFTLPSGPNAGSYIDFQEPTGGGNGAITVDGRTGDFLTLSNFGDPGFIRDLATGPVPLGGYALAPVGPLGSFAPINNFLTFAGGLSTTNIRLLQLPTATNCGGNVTCLGAFQLIQTGNDVSVSLRIIGDLINGMDVTPYTGTLTAQFSATTVGAVIAQALTPGGVTSFSWSGQLTAEIPEPETATLLGIGLIAMILGGLRAKKRSSI